MYCTHTLRPMQDWLMIYRDYIFVLESTTTAGRSFTICSILSIIHKTYCLMLMLLIFTQSRIFTKSLHCLWNCIPVKVTPTLLLTQLPSTSHPGRNATNRQVLSNEKLKIKQQLPLEVNVLKYVDFCFINSKKSSQETILIINKTICIN